LILPNYFIKHFYEDRIRLPIFPYPASFLAIPSYKRSPANSNKLLPIYIGFSGLKDRKVIETYNFMCTSAQAIFTFIINVYFMYFCGTLEMFADLFAKTTLKRR